MDLDAATAQREQLPLAKIDRAATTILAGFKLSSTGMTLPRVA